VIRTEQGEWVVIPAYNEAETIRDVALRTLRQTQHVIVVADGSTDGTGEALQGLPVVLLRNGVNSGKAASLWLGFERAMAAGALRIVTLDGDGQHRPEEIPALLQAARLAPDHLIIGARRPEHRRLSSWRYGANRAADFWISWASGSLVQDSQSGFRVYPSSMLTTLTVAHGRGRGFVFESEIVINAVRAGHGVHFVSIPVLPRQGTRPSHFRPVRDIVKIIAMVAWKLISRGLYPAGLYRVVTSKKTQAVDSGARQTVV
jgi:glycosyltransferase involved in cell wall biosynthesis